VSDLSGDLREHIYQSHANGPRRNSRWVMSPEWLNETRRIDTAGGASFWAHLSGMSGPEYLLGIPVEVRADGGPPHLEPL
jgi:predicted phage gp36 major capsid-like protein